MALCVAVNKSGPVSLFSSQHPVKDVGSFTAQQADVPLATRRGHAARAKQGRAKRRGVLLTPISEGEEAEFDFLFEVVGPYPSVDYNDDDSENSRSEGTSSRLGFRNYDDDNLLGRSDTPTILSGTGFTLSHDLATLVEETGYHDNNMKAVGAVATPRVKNKRKAKLHNAKPEQKIAKTKRHAEPLTSRSHVVEETERQSTKVHKQTTTQVTDGEQTESDPRPRSAETPSSNIIRLPSLSHSSSCSSTPSLPEMLEKLSKSGFAKDDILISKTKENSKGNENNVDNGCVDVASANDVSRMSVSPVTSPTLEDEIEREHCLKGSEMSLFYNMWERKKGRRPFDKKESDKSEVSLIRRGCHCLKKLHQNHLYQSPRKVHNGVILPPLRTVE